MALSEQEIIRREKLIELEKLGINPYPAELYPISHQAKFILDNYKGEENTLEFKKNGVFHRDNGQPASIVIRKNNDGVTIEKNWYINGKALESDTKPYSEYSDNGKVVRQRFKHDNPNKPTSINADDGYTVSHFDNNTTGLQETGKHENGSKYEIYSGGKNLIRTEGKSPIVQYKNMSNGYIKSIFKDDDNNIHFVSHDNGFANKITPNGEVYHYELNDGNQYDTTLDNRKNLNDLTNKVK